MSLNEILGGTKRVKLLSEIYSIVYSFRIMTAPVRREKERTRADSESKRP